ncbi:MAG: hypothetical protein RMK97_02210 [Sutterellaceae bacterium]|nr:hypothetical protein [Burkholderiaceae bacterium]MCX7901620.1 hypothetical protein [Burkholderiaceae bacterium]MDW8429309.1 hypothetical protein [Sutterellaceae bacterium]
MRGNPAPATLFLGPFQDIKARLSAYNGIMGVAWIREVAMLPMRSITLVGAFVAALIAGCATSPAGEPSGAKLAAAEQNKSSIEIISAQFGVFAADSSGRRILFETDKFPAVVSAPYGWYIVFRTNKPTVVWREEFELPEPPPTWGPGEALGVYTISPDRRTAVTERVIPTRLGFIANEWRYAPGDPIGAHSMRVYIDGQLIREFKFNIEEGPGSRQRPAGAHRSPTT